MLSEGTYAFSSLFEKTRKSNRCRCHYKGNTFSSVILRHWVLVRPRFEPARPLSLSRTRGARLLQRTEFILDKLIDHFHSRGQQLCTVLGSLCASGKLPTYPSPEPTLTLTSHLGQNFQFNSHRTFLLHQYSCRFIGFTPTWPLCTWHHVKRCFTSKCTQVETS